MAKNEITVSGIDVKYKKINKDDYISLTDLARYRNFSVCLLYRKIKFSSTTFQKKLDERKKFLIIDKGT